MGMKRVGRKAYMRPFLPILPVLVVLLLAIAVVPHGVVDEDIAWSGVKVIDLIDASIFVGWNETHISDAANVLACSELSRVVQDQAVQEGHERSSLSAISLLMDTEVVDDGFVEHLRHDGTFGHRERGLDLLATRHGEKPDGLTRGWRQHRRRR